GTSRPISGASFEYAAFDAPAPYPHYPPCQHTGMEGVHASFNGTAISEMTPEAPGCRWRPSNPVDPRGKAATRCKMDVQVGSAGICKKALDRSFQLTAVDELPSDQHCVGVKGAHRECAEPQLLRHAIDGVIGLLTFAHIDCEAHAVRRGNGVVLI